MITGTRTNNNCHWIANTMITYNNIEANYVVYTVFSNLVLICSIFKYIQEILHGLPVWKSHEIPFFSFSLANSLCLFVILTAKHVNFDCNILRAHSIWNISQYQSINGHHIEQQHEGTNHFFISYFQTPLVTAFWCRLIANSISMHHSTKLLRKVIVLNFFDNSSLSHTLSGIIVTLYMIMMALWHMENTYSDLPSSLLYKPH